MSRESSKSKDRSTTRRIIACELPRDDFEKLRAEAVEQDRSVTKLDCPFLTII